MLSLPGIRGNFIIFYQRKLNSSNFLSHVMGIGHVLKIWGKNDLWKRFCLFFRPSSKSLSEALQCGIESLNGSFTDFGMKTW